MCSLYTNLQCIFLRQKLYIVCRSRWIIMRKLDSEQVLVTVLMLFKASTESFVISVYVSFSCEPKILNLQDK